MPREEVREGIKDLVTFQAEYFSQSLNQRYFLFGEVIQRFLSLLGDKSVTTDINVYTA
ncbi:hypothetical protein [aff. Roholtiella sp. LEGE 12411]|uniref:hypothetical protein n=1 Tax=aff. Roholtiella sp. LEGE 12411 TaxID=1828822 RepID=UPI001882306D|nr:hypothetical protein [aff. Roholtiella sp. LEGE 12411]MBE9038225.1 hypothetical protein [aff. Roholtiella sp. LEGE 12411]